MCLINFQLFSMSNSIIIMNERSNIMKKLISKKIFILTLIIILFSVLLSGCIEIIPPPQTNTGTVKIIISVLYLIN